MDSVERHRTAIVRNTLSRPVATALADGLVAPDTSIFDYGCGRGDDVERLGSLGYEALGWDPVHRSETALRPADVVNLGYVVNVIENPSERADALLRAWSLAKSVLIVAARLDWEEKSLVGRRFGDGILTSKSTFQKFYSQEELRSWIDDVLGVRSVAAAPGIFYVFRDPTRAQSLLASRFRRPPSLRPRVQVGEATLEANRSILGPLLTFMQARGRIPAEFELGETSALKERFRSIGRAVALARQLIGEEIWAAVQARAAVDLVVYLALAAFSGRPRFAELPDDVQLDVKAFFGSHRKACTEADALLYKAGDRAAISEACRGSTLGKLTPEALYVHVTALGELSPLLRVYEGCGRALTGTVEGTTIIKLNHVEPKVTYLAYPDFDADPHPALATSIRANLRRLDIKYRDFRESSNPPILHRKETFVAPGYPRRDEFVRLTQEEEELGLFSNPVAIGTRDRWLALLESRGVRLEGHRLVPSEGEPLADKPNIGCSAGHDGLEDSLPKSPHTSPQA